MTPERQGQRGVALITVMLVAALASVLAITMLGRQHLSIAKTRQVVYSQQALEQALGAEAWVQALLRRDLEEDTEQPPVDGLTDSWATLGADSAPLELEAGSLEIRVRDLSGLLNLNAVVDAAGVDRMKRLLDVLGIDQALAEAIRDWIDEDQEVQAGGAEDGRYLVQDPPYRTANAPFTSVTELRLLPGVDADVHARLMPFVAALPTGFRRVNVNTAPGPVLAALAPGGEPERIMAFAAPDPPWADATELIAREVAFTVEAGVLATRSRFFEVLIRAEHGGQRVTLRSRVYRDPETGRTIVTGRDLARNFDRWGRLPDTDSDMNDDDDDAGRLPQLENR